MLGPLVWIVLTSWHCFRPTIDNSGPSILPLTIGQTSGGFPKPFLDHSHCSALSRSMGSERRTLPRPPPQRCGQLEELLALGSTILEPLRLSKPHDLRTPSSGRGIPCLPAAKLPRSFTHTTDSPYKDRGRTIARGYYPSKRRDFLRHPRRIWLQNRAPHVTSILKARVVFTRARCRSSGAAGGIPHLEYDRPLVYGEHNRQNRARDRLRRAHI